MEPPGSRYPSAHIWGFRLAGSSSQLYFSWEIVFKITVFLKYNSIINKQKSSKKTSFFSNVGLWYFRVQ